MDRGRGGRPGDAPPGRAPAGFTLLEIMVAILLLSVIVTASVSMLFVNLRGWNALNRDSDRVLDRTLIERQLAGALRHASPLVWQHAGSRRLAFSGEPHQVHFISRAPLQFRGGGMFEYLLTREPAADNRPGLVLYYAPYRPDQGEFLLPDEGQRRPLGSPVGDVTFSYLGSKRPGDRRAWWDSWEAEVEGYPEMVRIEFAGDGEGDREATLYVRLLTAGSRAGR